jgi:hypothetical protein
MTASQPLRRIISSASAGVRMSPLPMTGISGAASFRRAISSQLAEPE